MHHTITKGIYISLAFIFLIIGSIGIVLPVLPTTPFLLLASFFFARGSLKFHQWFVSTKVYKNHLESFVQTRAMTWKTKFRILIPASLMLSIAFVICPFFHGRIAIGLVIVFKYYYFFFRIGVIDIKRMH